MAPREELIGASMALVTAIEELVSACSEKSNQSIEKVYYSIQ
jgi:hypothetical protein